MSLLQKIYDKLAFQRRYDEIASWSLTPEQDVALQQVWDRLSPAIQKAIWKLLENMMAKYGEDKAKEMMAKILVTFDI